jgi:hypothetical protein
MGIFEGPILAAFAALVAPLIVNKIIDVIILSGGNLKKIADRFPKIMVIVNVVITEAKKRVDYNDIDGIIKLAAELAKAKIPGKFDDIIIDQLVAMVAKKRNIAGVSASGVSASGVSAFINNVMAEPSVTPGLDIDMTKEV